MDTLVNQTSAMSQELVKHKAIIRDAFGVIINVGDYIVYPGRVSSSVWINHGRVLETGYKVKYYGTTAYPYIKVRRIPLPNARYEKPRNVTLTNLDNIVIR